MMEHLYNLSKKINQNVKRNIVHIIGTINFFDDLLTDEAIDTDIADSLITYVRTRINDHNELSDFYYTSAIEYPYKTDPFISSRFSDGTFPVWYGSMDIKTTIYETAYHAFQHYNAVEMANDHELITVNRCVFDVHCHAILVDFVGKETDEPKLVDNDYALTQTLGNELYQAGSPGCLAPSARLNNGVNINVFNQDVLCNPQPILPIKYQVSLKNHSVNVVSDEESFEIVYH